MQNDEWRMQNEETEIIDPAPDWDSLTSEMHCPLCDYNLRGLQQPRCPECGFVFTWAELKRGQDETHPYLFEHHPKRNIWSFWRTYWRDCFPQTFWIDLSPAQPVRTRRLVSYWLMASMVTLTAVIITLGYAVWDGYQFQTNTSVAPPGLRPIFSAPTSGPIFLMHAPTPTIPSLWDKLGNAWLDAFDQCLNHSVFVAASTVLLWPWLTMLALLVFGESMRKARINKQHVLRVIVYGTDFGFVMLIPILFGFQARFSSGYPFVIALLCGGFTLYRVTIAYKDYLRFHMPFATVLASQIIVMLVFFTAYIRVVQH
jgi:hypothetical protein